MLPVVVIPCLDEAETLAATVRSLGFVPGGDTHAALVLIDNGSTDGTREIMDGIAASLPQQVVAVLSEADRGFVPARKAGVEAAASIAGERGLEDDAVLILQADADTIYGPGYCAAMAEAAEAAGSGYLLQALNEVIRDGSDPCQGLNALAAEIDTALQDLFADPAYDVVVDDKVAGYRLSDYRRWGGHAREVGRDGDEALAETTRLFLRGRLEGARRLTVDGASASTSQRRILEDPALAFSTGGYPRGPRWIAGWRRRYRGTHDLAAFHPAASHPELADAVGERTRHVLGMFGILPVIVAALLGQEPINEIEATYLRIARRAGFPDAAHAASRPALVVEAALTMSDREVDEARRRLVTGVPS